jgi:hypothetical protein
MAQEIARAERERGFAYGKFNLLRAVILMGCYLATADLWHDASAQTEATVHHKVQVLSGRRCEGTSDHQMPRRLAPRISVQVSPFA